MYDIVDFTLPELVVKGGIRHAGRPALSMIGGKPIMHDDLEPATRRVAALLASLGLKQGDRVALISENKPEWGLAALGISRLGCVIVPILVDFTAEQMNNIIEHSNSKAIIASRRFSPRFETEGAAKPGAPVLIALEELGPLALGGPSPSGAALTMTATELGSKAAALEPPTVKGDDLAAIIYTSGTTGHSKGVMLTHRNIIYDAWACRCFVVLQRRDRLLSILPLAHSYEFTIGLIIPMMMGSAVYYLDRPPSATALLPALKAVRPTILLSVPLVIEKIYRSNIKPSLDAIGLYKLPFLKPLFHRIAGMKLMKTFGGKIRFFGIGGAPLAHDVESFLHSAGFPYSIGYGLTETAPMVTGNRPGHVKLHTTGTPAIGVKVRIADPRPDSGEGEIQVLGPNVTPGYYKDPERTKEIFTEDGWFRTGDLGVIESGQRITVRGRLKTMILGASGENIYPEEVEAVLNASPYVAESLVYGDEGGLTALVQLNPEIMEELSALIQDTMDDAGEAVAQFARSFNDALESAGRSLNEAEKKTAAYLDGIKKQANERLAGFSRISKVRFHAEPFEKTPTQKIKRFLYQGKAKG